MKPLTLLVDMNVVEVMGAVERPQQPEDLAETPAWGATQVREYMGVGGSQIVYLRS